jgi:hypothetical protein
MKKERVVVERCPQWKERVTKPMIEVGKRKEEREGVRGVVI